MFIPRFLLTALCGMSAACALAQPGVAVAPPADRGTAGFFAAVTRIDHRTAQQMRGVSWKPGCPVPIRNLRTIRMTHRGFDGKVHLGELVVHKNVAPRVVRVFRKMYSAGFPIRRMKRIEKYNGSDDRSMAADNTSAFNCRPVTGSPGRFSVHSYGKAIDINTIENPYVNGNTVLPAAGRRYLDRGNVRRGMIVRGRTVTRAFRKAGFDWGGNWTSLKDYQHFEIPIR
jgi:D-alanyl-D-alanine carboxypeptidase